MCLILLATNFHPRYKLALAANRDEFHRRPTRAAAWWQENNDILAGQDLKAGGTWLGITRGGRLAAVTNYREKGKSPSAALSRGALVKDFLQSDADPVKFLAPLIHRAQDYPGFNLLCGTPDRLLYYSNRGPGEPQILEPGIYGLSNGLLDSPWPKVKKGKQGLQELLSSPGDLPIEEIFTLLSDRTKPPRGQLPDTGVGLYFERMLSPLFIESLGYGTRSSTVVTVDVEDRVVFKEKSFIPPGENDYSFRIS